MISSLTFRISALSIFVASILMGLVWLLADASNRTNESFQWVTHSADVIEAMDQALMDLRDAESEQRGYVLTRDPSFSLYFVDRIAGAREQIGRVVALTKDNPVQNLRARQLSLLIEERAATLRRPLDLARSGDFSQAVMVIASGKGRDLMTTITVHAATFLAEEHDLQKKRAADAAGRLSGVKNLALIGGPIIALLKLLVSAMLIRGIRQPVRVIQAAMTALGKGDRKARIAGTMGSIEFEQLARGYNVMADQLENAIAEQGRSERDLQAANEELHSKSETLLARGEIIELLGGMAHRMQAARTDEELANVIRIFVPKVLPGASGALYAYNNSRNMLVPVASWGEVAICVEGFAPNQCWALRRGQSHSVKEPGSDIICGHVTSVDAIYHCEPLLAGGEMIGTLFLMGRVEAEDRFRLTAMVENIASALVNHRLQRGLREQTIRDPLTGLFNRRYMEEALALEIARSSRSGEPLSVVMCDVDHFKRFNDEFGHDAGDAVLQAVGAEMRRHFRDSDIVCRYGGEEFAIIAPGSLASQLTSRVEMVRRAIAELDVRHTGRRLGRTSMSFGIAELNEGMDRSGAKLLHSADTALYQAKHEGRNRTVANLPMAA